MGTSKNAMPFVSDVSSRVGSITIVIVIECN